AGSAVDDHLLGNGGSHRRLGGRLLLELRLRKRVVREKGSRLAATLL
ncbi:MAG: hypothetical protein AVDCRST_MAG22-1719, partial [uncultured Rubrobacteraceae bacterium]